MKQERILCAALHFDDGKKYRDQPPNIDTGYIITGRRHDDCFTTLSVICKVSGGSVFRFDVVGAVKGFLSNTGSFYDRKQAYEVACRRGRYR